MRAIRMLGLGLMVFACMAVAAGAEKATVGVWMSPGGPWGIWEKAGGGDPFPAQRIGLEGRGLLRKGMYADITIFDPRTVAERGTREHPAQYPEGIRFVLVNGQPVVDGGKPTSVRSGRVLRGQGRTKKSLGSLPGRGRTV